MLIPLRKRYRIFSQLRYIGYILVILIITASCNESRYSADKEFVKDVEAKMLISDQIHKVVLEENTKKIFPRSLDDLGQVRYVTDSDWTSGFYPGCLWLTYELTQNELWKREASLYTEKLLNQQYNNRDHDIGFKIMSSFGNGFRLTKDPAFHEVIIQSARTLTSRFDKKVACIKSWDHYKDKWQYPVIIDNLINLELLFLASRLSGDPVYYNVAVQHANKTLENHMRPDGSCFHVVDYNPSTGEVIKKCTHQGYSDSSSWTRGQAWALYGFTMIYRETHNVKFLKQAEKTAEYILNHPSLAKDIIPKWDLEAANLQEQPKDVSAAAVIASALYELAGYSAENNTKYCKYADTIIQELSTDSYLIDQDDSKGFLLNHSTGNFPKNDEIDKPLIYADYYFLEALNRKFKHINP